jgi:3',5'-cyclic AMP phosphodiesterase CpdA
MSVSFAPLFRFGVIADPQYANLEPNLSLNRYPRLSLGKLSDAIAEFNQHELAFIVTLGDVIDGLWESFNTILPLYRQLRHPYHFLLGNHDFAVAPEHLAEVRARVGMPAAFYDFVHRGHRFILLDGNEVSLHAYAEGDARRAGAVLCLQRLEEKGALNAHRWNAASGEAQLAWLADKLLRAKAASEKVLIMNHYPVYPSNDHNSWDSDRILDLVARHDHVIAYFSGHNHQGNYARTSGTHFLNFKGMVDTPDTSAFAIVAVYPDRLEVTGYGREESRVLPLPEGLSGA